MDNVSTIGFELKGGVWETDDPALERLSAELAGGDVGARGRTLQLLGSSGLEERARGWLLLMRAVALGGAGLRDVVELVAAAEEDIPREEAATFGPLVGALAKELDLGASAATDADELAGVCDRHAASMPLRRLFLVRGYLCGMVAAGERTDELKKQLHRLSIGRVVEQRFLLAVAREWVSVARLDGRPSGADRELVDVFHETLWTIIALGRFELRQRAMSILGRLAAREAGSAGGERFARPPEGSPGALASAQEIGKLEARQKEWARLDRRVRNPVDLHAFLHGKYELYEQKILAVAGDPEARANLFQWVESGERGAFVTASCIGMIPELWSHGSRSGAGRIAETIVGILHSAEMSVAQAALREEQVSRGEAYRRRNLCLTALRMCNEEELAEPATRAIRGLLRSLERSTVTSFEEAQREFRVAEVVYPAAAALAAATDEPRDDDGTTAVLASLHALAGDISGDDHNWRGVGDCEAVLGALPVLLVGSEGGDWKRVWLETLTALVATPPDPADLYLSYRYLAAWRTVNELVAAVLRSFSDRAPIVALRQLAAGEAVSEVPIERLLITAVLTTDLTRLEPLCRPLERALTAGRELAAESGGAPAPRLVFSACAWEARMLGRLPGHLAAWSELSHAERFWLARIYWLLASGSVMDFLAPPVGASLPREFNSMAARACELAKLVPVKQEEEEGEEGEEGKEGKTLQRSRDLIHLVRTLDVEAADALGEDLQLVVDRHLSPAELGATDARLDENVQALVHKENSFKVCEQIARLVEKFLLEAKAASPPVDIVQPLYQLVLWGPNPEVFSHLAVRLEEKDELDLAVLIFDHILKISCSRPDAGRLATLTDHLSRLLDDLARFDTPALAMFKGIVDRFVRLARVDRGSASNTWPGARRIEDVEGMQAFFAEADRVAAEIGHELALEERCGPALEEFRERLQMLEELDVAQLAEKERAASTALASLQRLRRVVEGEPSLRWPLQALMGSLLAAWEERLEAVRKRFVRASHLVQTGNTQGFYDEFVHRRDGTQDGQADPPPDPAEEDERRAYERFFVRWASSRLDLPVLKNTIVSRWHPTLRVLYGMVTSLRGVLALIVAPYALLALLVSLEGGGKADALRGAGFALYAGALFLGLLVVLVVTMTSRHLRGARPHRDQGPAPYAFHCLLPRLIALIVIPMALLVGAGYTYSFALQAPSEIIVLVLVLTLLATLFYVMHEVSEQGAGASGTRFRRHRTMVPQITGLALFQAFVTSILLSTVFPSKIFFEEAVHEEMLSGEPFLGLPRWVTFNPASALEWRFWDLTIEFEPVTILVWTALGLFSGIFLEGFLRRSAQAESPFADR